MDYEEFRRKMGDATAPLFDENSMSDTSLSGAPMRGGSVSRVLQSPAAQVAMGTMNPAAGLMGPTVGAINNSLRSSLPAGAPAGIVQSAPPAVEELSPLRTELPAVQLSPTLAQLGSQASPGRPGGGDGGGGGPSPLGGLKANWEAAQQKQVADVGDQMALQGQVGNAAMARNEGNAQFQEDFVQAQQKLAADQQKWDQDVSDRHQAILQRNMDLADEVSKQQIDPNRLMNRASGGQKVMWAIGNALGDFVEGFSGGAVKNRWADNMNRAIDRDVAAQQEAINNKKAALSSRQSLFGQMLQETGDSRLAQLQTRNLMLESGKQWLAAQSERLQNPSVKAENDIKINLIQQQQDSMKEAIARGAYGAAVQQANAAAAARAASERAAFDRQLTLLKLGQEADKIKIEAMKAGKEGKKEVGQEITETTKRLGDDDIVKNANLVDSLNRRIKLDANGNPVGVEGLSKLDDIRSQMAPNTTLGKLPAVYALNKLAGNDADTRIAQQEFNQLKLLYQTKVTGSGGSDEQMKKIAAAFEGAGSPEEKARVISMAKADLEMRRASAMNNLSDEGKAEFARRQARDAGLKPIAPPPGVSKEGWIVSPQGNSSDERTKRFVQKMGGY